MIRFRALGAPDLRRVDGQELRSILAQPKRFALFTYLALATPGGFQRRDVLLAMFWPEFDSDHAHNALRQAVHHLRQALGTEILVNRGAEELGLDPARTWCDAARFEVALAEGETAEALELYRGDLLPGFFVSGAPEFERWLDAERARLRERAAAAAWQLAEREAARGDASVAIHWGRWAAARTPDDEGAMRRLMQLHIRLGDRTSAIRTYEQLAARLAEDYGIEPSPETRDLVAALRGSTQGTTAIVVSPRGPDGIAAAPSAISSPGAGGPAPGSQAGRRWRHLALPAVAVSGALIVAAVVWPERPRSAIWSRDAIAVLPFAVRGKPDLLYLQEGMVDLLSTNLDGVVGVRSIDPRAVLGAARGGGIGEPVALNRAARVAERVGAGAFVLGDVVELAGRVQLSAALYDRRLDWQAAATASVEGEAAELFELVDNLAGQLLAGRIAGRDTALTRLAALTTNSLPALKSYIEGERELRAGREPEATSAFLDAIARDSMFALAHYRLALAARWVSAGKVDAPGAAARAAQLANRLSPMVRALLTAYTEYLEFAADSAEARYRAVADARPDNVEAWFMLGETLFHYNPPRGRPSVDARFAFERALALDPTDAHAVLHLTRIAALEGRSAVVDSLARRFSREHQTADRALEVRALRAFSVGDRAEQAAVLGELRDANDIVVDGALNAAAIYAQDLQGARTLAPLYTVKVRHPVWSGLGRRVLTDLPSAAGIWKRPTGELSPVWDSHWALETRALIAAEPLFGLAHSEIVAMRDTLTAVSPFFVPTDGRPPQVDAPPRMFTYLLGLLSVRLGDYVAARQHAERLELFSTAPGDSGISRHLAHGVRAEVARTQGDLPQALVELEQISYDVARAYRLRFSAHAGVRERFLRAELLSALGRDEEALQWYGSFPSAVDDLMYLAPSHLRRGQIYERVGDRERAIAHYTRFIRLWKDCDPEFRPLVVEAEQALARLQGADRRTR
jgi:DNA-binding SARP family transcriptional activator